jgi:hypothetical protein
MVISEWWIENDLDWRQPWSNLSYYPGIRLDGLRKPTKTLDHYSRSPGQDLNPVPPEYEAGELITRPRSVWRSYGEEYKDGCLLGCSIVQSGWKLPTFLRNLLPPSSGRSLDRGRGASETSVNIYLTKPCNIPGECHMRWTVNVLWIFLISDLLQHLKEAWLTYSFHCCAFKFPARHDPTRHALHQVTSSRQHVL